MLYKIISPTIVDVTSFENRKLTGNAEQQQQLSDQGRGENDKMSDRLIMDKPPDTSQQYAFHQASDYERGAGEVARQAAHRQPSQTEQALRLAGLAVGQGSMIAIEVLSHPFIIFRRQCQVHSPAGKSHLTPITLMPVMVRVLHQGNQPPAHLMWKGFISTMCTRGIALFSDNTISEMPPFYLPKEVSKYSSLTKLAQHILLKCMTHILLTPLYISCVIETVQSCERPGLLDFIIESRIPFIGRGSHSSRLMPLRYLLIPTVLFKLAQYITQSVIHYTAASAHRRKAEELKDNSSPVDGQVLSQSVYEEHFPELFATFMSAFLADMMLFPFETVLHRLYVQGTRILIDNMDSGVDVVEIKMQYEGFLDCLRGILLDEGLQGLYQGFGAFVLQYMLHVALLKVAEFLFKRITEVVDHQNGDGHRHL